MNAPTDEVGRLLDALAALDVRLSTDGTVLHYDAPAGVLNEELVSALRRFKPQLIRQLSELDSRVERSAPASVNQARQYRLTMATDEPSAVTIAQRFALRGRLDRQVLRTALTALVARHPALRTRFQVRGEQIRQQVLVPEPVPLPVVPTSEADLDRVVRDWAVRPFDLEGEPAFRAILFEPAPEWAELVLAMHHGISDGWSMTVLITDLAELYRAELGGRPPDLPALPADFVDFTYWEREHLRDPATAAAVRAWAADARRCRELPALPTDRPRADRGSDAGALWHRRLPVDLARQVTDFAARHGTTPFAVLFAVFGWLLHELTGTPDAVVRCGVANRTEPRFEHVVGMFTHTSWLIAPMRGAVTFADLLPRVSRAVWDRLALQSVPGDVLNDALGPPFDVSFNDNPPRVIFSMFDTPMPTLELPGLAPAAAVDVALSGARADQAWLFGAVSDGGLELQVEYVLDLFDERTVTGWADRYRTLLDRALADPGTPLRADHRPIG